MKLTDIPQYQKNNNPLIWKIFAKDMLSPAKFFFFYGNWKDITLPYQQQNEEHEIHNS